MNIAIFGASGLAVEVAELSSELGYRNLVFVIEKNTTLDRTGLTTVFEEDVTSLDREGYQFIIAIGEPKIRKKVYLKFKDLPYINVIHPSATFGIFQKSVLEKTRGNIIFAGARFTSNIQISQFGIFNQNCTIAHDCIIENFVTIGPGANISGNVHLKEAAYIGTGAVILQGKSLKEKLMIGTYATVGAGAVVTRDVKDYQTVKGIPAR